MIRKFEDTTVKENVNMRGGDGTIVIRSLLDKDKDEFYGKGRLFGQITVAPGCSIGYHEHDGEMECFYVIAGSGVFNDNGVETRVQKGDVLYTGSGTGHAVSNDASENLELIALILYK